MKMNSIKIMIILGSLFLASCAPQVRYNVLSFFFDGVPDPDLEVNVAPGDSLVLASLTTDSITFPVEVKPSVLYHYPYQEKECMLCHDPESVGSLISAEPNLCYQCHEDYSQIYSNLHGPVEAGYCSVCHEPHMSKVENLLQLEVNKLCAKCHVEFSENQPDFHIRLDDEKCTVCHNPHGEGELL